MSRFVLSLLLAGGGLIGLLVRKALPDGSRGRMLVPAGMIVAGVLLAATTVLRVVPANTVGIPTNFGSIGDPMSSGLRVTYPWTEINELSTRIQELSMLRASDEGDLSKDDSIRVIAEGGGSMAVDLTVRYSVDPAKAGDLFRQAGTMDLIKDRFVRPDAREVARNVFSLYTAEEGYSSKRGEIAEQIFTNLAPRLANRGILVDSINVRDVEPEAQVLTAINDILAARNAALTAAEEQKRQVTEAETRKQVAERDAEAAAAKAKGEADAIRIRAQAEAEANRQIALSLTPELLDLQITQACANAIAQTNAAVVSICGTDGQPAAGGVAAAAPTVVVDSRQ
jgi:regulator of protease activity HflC (stomatin/prohibitin superfamily)